MVDGRLKLFIYLFLNTRVNVDMLKFYRKFLFNFYFWKEPPVSMLWRERCRFVSFFVRKQRPKFVASIA